jgi:hypothetical protein
VTVSFAPRAESEMRAVIRMMLRLGARIHTGRGAYCALQMPGDPTLREFPRRFIREEERAREAAVERRLARAEPVSLGP